MATPQFDSIKADVVQLTSRPDLDSQITLAIKTATAKAHTSEEYPQDKVIVEISPVLDPATGTYSVDISSVPFVRHRKVLQLLDVVHHRELTKVDPTDLFADNFGKRTDIFYQAGYAITIVAYGISSLKCVYLKHPDTTEASYSSWIADERPDLIAFGAASIIQDLVGRKEERDSNKRLFLEGIAELKANYVV